MSAIRVLEMKIKDERSRAFVRNLLHVQKLFEAIHAVICYICYMCYKFSFSDAGVNDSNSFCFTDTKKRKGHTERPSSLSVEFHLNKGHKTNCNILKIMKEIKMKFRLREA